MNAQGTIGKAIAIALLTLMTVIALRPVPAQAFGPIGAVGGALNAIAGAAISNDTAETPAAPAERRSRAEAILGVDDDTGAASVADAVRDPGLVRATIERASR